jgi:hypothetical protein
MARAMNKKTLPKSTDRGKDEPSFEDFVALVRRKMIEDGEDPDALDADPMDFTEDVDSDPWLN